MLRQLEYLVALAREKHFGRAAEACHVSQPTLSAAIRQLEEDLGAPIVERGHRYLGLTPQGQARARARSSDAGRGGEPAPRLEEIDKGLAGRLRIGAIPTALPIVSQLTGPFCAKFPGVSVTVLSLPSQDIERGIEAFELDAGLTYLDAEPIERVQAKPVCIEEYAFLTPDGRRARRPRQSHLEGSGGRAAVPAHPRYAEPAHHRRHFPFGGREAGSDGRDELDLQPRLACQLRPMVGYRAPATPPLLRRAARTRARSTSSSRSRGGRSASS